MYFKLTIEFKEKNQKDFAIADLISLPITGVFEEETKLTAYFKSKPDSAALDALSEKYTVTFGTEESSAHDWLLKFKNSFSRLELSDKLNIVPLWNKDKGDSNSIYIMPGLAFGTGLHFTTKSSLELMETLNFENKKVLDFGCGTGILSIYAERLGAGSILAVDNDIEAVKEAKKHCRYNECKKVKAAFGDIFDIPGKFDIILANILFEVLAERLPYLSDKLNRNGYLLFAGVITPYKENFIKALEDNNLKIIKIVEDREWVSGLSILE